MNPFDLKAALSADHAQHPVIIHFPIALFIASAVFDLLAVWRKQSVLASVAYYNLVGAAISVPLAIATGSRSVAMASRGRGAQGQLAAASDRCAHVCVPDFLALLDALAPPREGKLAGACLFRTNLAGGGDHYAHRASRRVSERCGDAVRWIIAIRARARV